MSVRHRFFIASSLSPFLIAKYLAFLHNFPLFHPLPTLLDLPPPNLWSPAPLTNPSHPLLSLVATTLSPPPPLTKSTFPQCNFSFSFFEEWKKWCSVSEITQCSFFLLNFFYRGVKLDDESVKSHLRPIRMNDFIMAVEKSKSNTDFHRWQELWLSVSSAKERPLLRPSLLYEMEKKSQRLNNHPRVQNRLCTFCLLKHRLVTV